VPDAPTLESLAIGRFGKLLPAEIKLVQAAPAGRFAFCNPITNMEDPSADPSKADAQWKEDRTIRAPLIRWLCTDPQAKGLVDPKGIQIADSKIVDDLDLSYISVPFPLRFRRCRLTRPFNIRGAEIPQLDAQGTRVRSIGGDRCVVKGSIYLRNEFYAEGEVRLLNAHIGGDLNCRNGTFHNPQDSTTSRAGFALTADRARIDGSTLLNRGFHSDGMVSLSNAAIGGNLECRAGEFNGRLQLEGAQIKGMFLWTEIVNPANAQLDLANASAGVLVDDPESWLAQNNLQLDGFIYDRISDRAPKDATRRLDWLMRLKEFAPQPYRQLAKILREEGDDDGARRVLFTMEQLRRKKEDADWFARVWSFIIKLTIGYGYYPAISLLWLLLLVDAGSLLFQRGQIAGTIVPVEEKTYSLYTKSGQLPPQYPRFNSSIYSLENSFPLAKFGQVDTWQPDPITRATSRPLGRLTSPGFLRGFRVAQIVLGWFFATMGVAGVTGILRKD
jgi:hypothetical protein